MMGAADLYANMVKFVERVEALQALVEQVVADAKATAQYLLEMPSAATEIRISFGDFEDYTGKPAPLVDMVAATETGGAWIVRARYKLREHLYFVNRIDVEKDSAELVRVDLSHTRVTVLPMAARNITGTLLISKHGA